MTLTQWNPYRDLVSIRDTLDRLVDDRLPQAFNYLPGQRLSSQSIPVDMYEVNGEIVIKTNLPGVKPDDIEITLKGDRMTIKGDFRSEDDDMRDDVHILERHYGKFQRTITLPENIDSDHVDALYEDGVLTLSLPKSEESKPKQISVRS